VSTQPSIVLLPEHARQAGERVLARLLGKPRMLQATAVLLCGLLALHSLVPRATAHQTVAEADDAAVRAPDTVVSVAAEPAVGAGGTHEVIAVVERYNRASIAAGQSGDVRLLAPFLAPQGGAWSAVQTEYARRIAVRERHDAVLRRWGVLDSSIQGNAATVVTQELWDDVVRSAGRITASERGLLVRNTYTLRRSASGWLIVDVTGETIIR
jgi:hypothetical protein